MNRIETGMKVKFIGDKKRQVAFSGKREVEGINYSCGQCNEKWYYMKGFNYGYKEEELEIAFPYNLEKGDVIIVGNYIEDLEIGVKYIFDSYRPDIKHSFVVDNKNGGLCSFEFAKSVQSKFKPYTEPKLEWIDTAVLDTTGTLFIINGFKKVDGTWYLCFLGTAAVESLEKAVKGLTIDGAPFGEEVK